MIRSYVVHVVVDAADPDDLTGVVEEVGTGDRHPFASAGELVTRLRGSGQAGPARLVPPAGTSAGG